MEITKNQVQAFLKSQFKQGDLVVKLVFINLGVYFFMKAVHLIEWIFRIPKDAISTFISSWFYLPNQASALWYKFYTLLTYQFVHDSFWHIFLNILMLFFFGKLLIKQIGFKKLLPLYLIGGVFGGLLFVLASSSNLFSTLDQPMIGASASIMALMGASAFIMPDYKLKFFLIFDIKLKWLVAGFALLTLLSMVEFYGESFNLKEIGFSPNGTGSGIIHLGGLLFGLIFMLLLKQGVDISKPFNRFVNFFLAMFNKRPKPRVSFVNTNKQDVSVSKSTIVQQEKVNEILDKISEDGYESLSKEEKDYLFKASKQ